MKKYMRMTVLFFLIIIFCSYNQITEIGVQSFDVNVARQENPTWCLFATLQMALGGEQCLYAGQYIKWSDERAGIISPPNWDCCQVGIGCGGVEFDECIEYWNHKTSSSYFKWEIIPFTFYKNSPTHRTLPTAGLLDLRSAGAEYHAIWVYHVTITYNSVWDMTTYKVEYIDPWTGDYDFVESQSSGSGNLWSRVYIMV